MWVALDLLNFAVTNQNLATLQVEHAYRQNRMATTALVRHLQAFKVAVPVFGMIWAEGTVRIHVDWAGDDNAGRPVCLLGVSIGTAIYLSSWIVRGLCEVLTFNFG